MTGVYVPPINQRERIPQEAIDDVVRQIVEKFHPQKIILFGSYARGDIRPESDVDLLVVMETTRAGERPSLQIRRALNVMFGLDIVVYSPQILQQRLAWGDSFLREIIANGKVLYESPN